MPENPLEIEIRRRIALAGPMPFRDFMELALYHPDHGYYSSGRAEIGRAGDYFTSVSVGSLFGELYAWQFREMWEALGRPKPFTVVEQGANDGAFAADVLGWASRTDPAFFEALRYEIVEGFAPLRKRQEERLGEFAPKLTWRESLEELPRFTGVHFSNELVDAFPVHLVRYTGGEWRERYVSENFAWLDLPVTNERLLARLSEAPRQEGYITEVNLEAEAWAERIARKLSRGWVVAVDYGFSREQYYSPERSEGTLQAYAGHARRGDPLRKPGMADLTAHVDFTSVAESFLAAGLDLAGYTDQHHFLVGLSARAFAGKPPDAKQTRALKTLLHPEMLGTRFQVLVMARDAPATLAGLQYGRDPRAALGL